MSALDWNAAVSAAAEILERRARQEAQQVAQLSERQRAGQRTGLERIVAEAQLRSDVLREAANEVRMLKRPPPPRSTVCGCGAAGPHREPGRCSRHAGAQPPVPPASLATCRGCGATGPHQCPGPMRRALTPPPRADEEAPPQGGPLAQRMAAEIAALAAYADKNFAPRRPPPPPAPLRKARTITPGCIYCELKGGQHAPTCPERGGR